MLVPQRPIRRVAVRDRVVVENPHPSALIEGLVGKVYIEAIAVDLEQHRAAISPTSAGVAVTVNAR